MKWFGLLIFLMTLLPRAQGAQGDDFGRLFSQPSVRSDLDKLRKMQPLTSINQNIHAKNHALNPPSALTPIVTTTPSPPVSLQGYVKRHDGKKSTCWINGKAVQEGDELEDGLGKVQVGHISRLVSTKKEPNAEGVDIKILSNGQHIQLKVGQTYDHENNAILHYGMHQNAE